MISPEKADVEVLSEPLGHPEGPDFLPDGGLVFVEADSGRLGVWYGGRSVVTLASCGGSPYGCAVGEDGRAYITQAGREAGPHGAPRPIPPSIQRASRDGSTVEILCTEVDGIPLGAPNDLAWGADGRLYFTDSGRWNPEDPTDPGYVFALGPEGGELILDLGPVFPNGIAAEEDGSIIWLESYSRRVGRRRPDGGTEILATLAEGHTPEGVAIAADGTLWITTFEAGTVDILAPDGTLLRQIEIGGVPCNSRFGDGHMYVTDFGEADPADEMGPRAGRLVRFPVDAEGQAPIRGALP